MSEGRGGGSGWLQGRTQYMQVVLTGGQQQALVEWAWMHGDAEALSSVRDALVTLTLERPVVERLVQPLLEDRLTALAGAFRDALETVRGDGDLSSDERTLIQRIRRMGDGELKIEVFHGTPVVEPTRHWHWGEGRTRRRRKGEANGQP